MSASTSVRRSRRLAGLPPAYVYTPPADAKRGVRTSQLAGKADTLEAAARGAISWKVAAAAIGREAYRLYPVGCMIPDVTDEVLYDRLMGMVAYVIHRIFLSGDSGRFRSLTNAEAVAWVRREHDKSHIWLMQEMISGWMAAPSGKWRVRNWEEEHVEIAMRTHSGFMAALEAAMGPPLKGAR